MSESGSDEIYPKKNRRRPHSSIAIKSTTGRKKRKVNSRSISGRTGYQNILESISKGTGLFEEEEKDEVRDASNYQGTDCDDGIEFDSELWAKLQAGIHGTVANHAEPEIRKKHTEYASSVEERIDAFAIKRLEIESDICQQRLSVEKIVTLRMLFHASSTIPIWTEGHMKIGATNTEVRSQISDGGTSKRNVRIFPPLLLSVGNGADAGSLIQSIWFKTQICKDVCNPPELDERIISRRGQVALAECNRRAQCAKKWLRSVGLWNVEGGPQSATIKKRLRDLFPNCLKEIDQMCRVVEDDKEEVIRLLKTKFCNTEQFEADYHCLKASNKHSENDSELLNEEVSMPDGGNGTPVEKFQLQSPRRSDGQENNSEPQACSLEIDSKRGTTQQEDQLSKVGIRTSPRKRVLTQKFKTYSKSRKPNPFIDSHAEASDEESSSPDLVDSPSDFEGLSDFLDDETEHPAADLGSHLRLHAAQKELQSERLYEKLFGTKISQSNDPSHDYLIADLNTERPSTIKRLESPHSQDVSSAFSVQDDSSDREDSEGSFEDNKSSSSYQYDDVNSPRTLINLKATNKDETVIRRQRYRMGRKVA